MFIKVTELCKMKDETEGDETQVPSAIRVSDIVKIMKAPNEKGAFIVYGEDVITVTESVDCLLKKIKEVIK